MAVVTDAFHPLFAHLLLRRRQKRRLGGSNGAWAAAALTPSSVAFMHGLHAFSPSRAAVRAQQLSPDTDAQGRTISPGHFSDIAVIFALFFVGFSDD